MKINKKVFISALLVLVMIGVMGTVSATDSLNNDVAADTDDAVSVEVKDNLLTSTNDDLLGDGENIIYVDSSYSGEELGTEDNPYKSISSAVSNANGGETIFIKNGVYNENPIKDTAKQLTFQGESQDGTIIKFESTGFFSTTKSDYGSVVFKDLTFKDSACTGANMAINIGGNVDVNITDCTFDNVSGRYGAVRIFTSGTVLIDNCKFLNTKSSTGSYASAIDFGGSSATTYTLRNTIIDNSTISSESTASYIFGVIYAEKTAGTVILDNVTITNCNITASGIIAAKGNMEIRNSKIMNNYVYRDNPTAGLFFVNGLKNFTLETSILLNNSQPNYIFAANSNSNFNVNYNNIQNNTFKINATHANGAYNLDYNYWGSNDGPTGLNVDVNNWAIDDNGEFKLNDGSPLAKEIPRTGEPVIGDENSTWVSVGGDDNNTGSQDSPVATIAKAVELAKTRSGEIFIEEGTYTENNIVLDSDIAMSITGIGNVVIDGNASSNSIFILHNDATVAFSNIRFTNNKARYGGAIFVNSGTGTGRTVVDVNMTVDGCTFDNLDSSSRGAGIYLWYAAGNLIVTDSKFINSTAGSWGGAICAGQSAASGLNVEITGCTFENCSANNGGGAYLQANTVNIVDSVFNHNTASYDSAAVQINNATASIDNCIITNNQGDGEGVAIKITMPSGQAPRVTTIVNSVIENNSGITKLLPAIYVDMTTLDVSYSSVVNNLSVETRTATGYDAIYGQGIATVNNNWWGTNDPSTKVKGTNITMDNWVIMNVVANASEAIVGDKVAITVDFNHVNTTAGEIEELTGGVIPKTYKVQLSADSGTFAPASLTIKDGATKTSVYTVGDINDIVSVSSEEALVEMSFMPEVPPYYGIIYVSKDGDDNNNGSEDAPVATIAKAIELASIVGGSGQIVVNEGTYNGTDYLITKDLTITGVGNVIFDAEGKSRFFYLPSGNSIDKFELNNIALINSAANPEVTSGYYGTIMYSYSADNIILNNVTIMNNDANIATLISTNAYNLVINNSVISDSVAGKLIALSGKYDSLEKCVTIVNTTFENNVAPDYRIIEVGTSSGSLTLNLTDSHFINNVGKLGIVQGDSKTTMNVVGTEFISNTNNVSSGGALDAYKLNVVNSSFINNKAARDGGAINIAGTGDAVISKSSFINNTAGGRGNAIYNGNKLAINYSVLLTDSAGYIIYHDGDDNVMEAKYNWWGTNDDPSSLIGVGTYEDDWGDDADCEFDASKWVVMNVNNNLTSEDVNIDDEIEFTVDFNHYTDSTGAIQELDDSIPEVEVSASALNGEMDKDKVTTEDNLATFVYTATVAGEDTITIASTNAINTTVINVAEPVVVPDVIYVSVDGSDDNSGAADAPVATIAHAIEIAENGKIVILAGEYTINATLVINKDLDIAGEGNVVIDGNSTRIMENTANLNLTNIAFTNAKMGFGSVLLDDGNTIIDNCSFYGNRATATSSGNIVNNRKGSMTVVNSKFFENVCTRGIVASQSGSVLVVNNSEFYSNNAPSSYGMVYTTGATSVVENTVFRDNVAKQGAGIWSSGSSSTAGVLDVINCTFINNTAEAGSGAGLFASGTNTVNVYDSTFINNTAVSGTYAVGNGGAIYTTGYSSVSVVDSVLIDNAGAADAGIYAAGTSFDISNSVILARDGDNNSALNGAGAAVTANDNFWGDNSKANANVAVDRWVIMSADYDEDTGVLAVSFDKTNSTGGDVADYAGVLPDGFNVTAVSSTGGLDVVLPVVAGVASTTYSLADDDAYINVTCRDAVVSIPFEPVVVPDVIYVSVDGSDDNSGAADAPVATIAHAIEIAENGKIVILAGEYTINATLVINKDLDIAGEGNVVIDGNSTRIIENTANLNLTNLVFTNAKSTYGSVLADNGNTIIDNCTFYGNAATATRSANIINNMAGTMVIDNSKFYNNIASRGVIASQAETALIVNNSEFYDNDMTSFSNAYGIIYSTSADAVVENTVFRNNKVQNGGAIYATKSTSATAGSLEVINCTFEDNMAYKGTGGAIFASGSLTVDIYDSTFINNTAVKSDLGVGGNGGAIYTTGSSDVTVINSVLIDNAGDADAGIYASGNTFDISNSIILAKDDDTNPALNVNDCTVTANDNFWGDNSKANTNADVERWVIMTATYDEDSGVLAVSFDKTNSTSGTIADYAGVLPDGLTVAVISSSGKLDEVLPVISGQASTTYVKDDEDRFIKVTCSNAEVIIKFMIKPDVIYVAMNGSDDNYGTIDDPVATIAHAVEIAEKGKIIILEGNYTTGYLGIISGDLNITGEGRVVIDAQNNNRILYVGTDGNVTLQNLIMINGCDSEESGALLGNSNILTLINCTLANSTSGERNGGAIYNIGKLTIINSTIANNTAKEGGAIWSNYGLGKDAEITIIDSIFENNIATGSDNFGGGAIFAQQLTGLTISGTTFKENQALSTSSGGAIFLSHITDDLTITDSKFIANHANGQEDVGGGAIYMVGTSNYERKGKLTITNTLFEENTADSNGAAIYARATTVNVANSVIFANKDAAGFAVYGYKTEQVSPSITLNDNWWGTNEDPSDFVGGNRNYKPTLSRWVILTATNDTPIVEGNNVKITVSLDTYTDGETNGTLSTPITIPRDVIIETTFESIEGVLENGEFTTDYVIPADLKEIDVYVDIECIVLYKYKEETTVEIDNITAIKGDTATINAVVKTIAGDNVTGGEVEVYFGDDLVATIPVIDGVASQDVEINKDYGVYTILAKFIDTTGELLDSEATATLTVIGYNLTVKEDNYGDYGSNITVPANFTDNNGVPVEGVEIIMIIGENNYTEVTDSMGQVEFDISDVLPGTYNATIKVKEYEIYKVADVYANVVINKLNSTIVVDPVITIFPDENIFAILVDNEGNGIGNASVIITINNESTALISDENGQVTLPIKDFAPGTYPAAISYEGDSIYNPSEANTEVIVHVDTSISVLHDEAAKELIATLINNHTGDGINDAEVVINVGGENYTVKTNSSGKAKVSIADLDAGPYSATVTYEGSVEYNPSNATIGFYIKADTVVSAVYDEVANEIVATLIDNATGEPVGYADVIISVGGENYTVKTNSSGIAVVSVADLVAGPYTADVAYEGSANYNPSAASVDFIVKADTVVSAVYDDDAKELTVSLTDNVTGDAIAGADVVITVGSDVFNVVTDDNGQAVQALDLVAGAYTADVAYDGSVMYNPSAASVDFIVKADTVVSAVYDDDAKELVATLINNVTGQPIKGGTVRFNVDGVKYTVKSDAKGQAKISTADLAPGTYTATVSYKGNTKYNPSATTVDMVVKLNAVIIVEDLFVEYGGDAEVVATLMDLDAVQPIAGADITFNINGESYNATTDDNGQAKVTVSGLAPDTYTATVSYEGDDTYKSISEEFTIVVNKMSTSISAVYNAETNEFIATLINTETGAGIKGATVVMYLNGAKTNVKTDKNGQAIFVVDDADLTAYHAAFSYGGNFKYLKSTTSINAVENKTTTTLSTVYDKETGEIVATLTNTATGAFIKGANVVITVNGVKNVVKTDKNGQSKVLIEDLDAGQYSVSSSYGGNSKYAKTTTNINIVKFDSEGDL